MREKTVAGRTCRVYKAGEAGPVLLQAADARDLESLDREAACIRELTPAPFTLAAFAVEDWNRELSPWEAPAVFGTKEFGAGAAETLAFLAQGLLPELYGTEGKRRCYLGGYSLAGLFALWAAYQTDLFSGIAAVSPSVWFPGWAEYMERHTICTPRVYLSLGDGEEKTRNQTMAAVGDNLRRQHQLLCRTDRVTRCELEWNPGNHFTDPAGRMAKGFAWLLDRPDG